MIRRFLVSIAVLAALAAALMASAAQAAPGVDAGVKTRSSAVCGAQIAFYDKLDSLAAVRVVREEYDNTAPVAASAALTDWVDQYHPGPCADTADLYVRLRVSATAYQWYLAVVAIYGT